MLRAQVIKLAQADTLAVRSANFVGRHYATTPPGQPAPNHKAANESDNTLLYTGIGLATAAGAYYYLRSSDGPTLAASADDTLQKSRAKVDQLEDATKEKYNAAKSQVKGVARDAKEEGRGLLDKAEDKLEYANRAARDGLNQTRESTEVTYHNVRDKAARKSEELRADANKGTNEVKEGWFGWAGYGKSKIDDAENSAREARDEVDAEAERLRKEAAKKVARAAEDVRIKADRHA